MSDLIRCSQCNGLKRIMGTGHMMHSCPDCLGVGFIKEIKETLSLSDSENDSSLPKRRGRPVKAKDV